MQNAILESTYNISPCRHTGQGDFVVARAINFMSRQPYQSHPHPTASRAGKASLACYASILSTKLSRNTSTRSSMDPAASASVPSFHPQSTHVRREAPDIHPSHLGQHPCSDPPSLISILICYVVRRHCMQHARSENHSQGKRACGRNRLSATYLL